MLELACLRLPRVDGLKPSLLDDAQLIMRGAQLGQVVLKPRHRRHQPRIAHLDRSVGGVTMSVAPTVGDPMPSMED